MGSYDKINYLLRPNKSVERKMVCEMLSGISSIKDLSTYMYVGLGSVYFADFLLFHRSLGIAKMVSIESDDKVKDRCEFNKPFSCIDLKMGESTNILPNLDIQGNYSIVWMDYDGAISDSVFSDINTVVGKMRPDSFFMLSLNADTCVLKTPLEEDGEVNPEKRVVEMIGDDRFPNQFRDKEMTAKTYLSLLHHCIMSEIAAAVRKRNAMADDKVVFHQTVNFLYLDGIRMLTLGGFLFKENEMEDHLTKMCIRNLPYYKNDVESFKIQCPVLSLKEIQALNSHLPCIERDNGKLEDDFLNDFPLNNSDIRKYAALYRYYPSYVETLL